ncbi:hypothetical protein HC251_00525 [Iamia sp. SCSIO 61187]|uniref:hypothetical protein n=1 Tax=Iamia sp. SCSIO 61187 TaxID=2722752 RepID=UPI001C62BD8A|nr:hypothetical protein [Iamia sp. SCSIO 61187]QYG91066.1 hypothetical protein HC251_00525 [Iamia sp. SCSIO 61187]
MPHPPTTPKVSAASVLAGPRDTIVISLWIEIDSVVLSSLPEDAALLLAARDAGTTTLAVASSDGLILLEVPSALIDAALASRRATIAFRIAGSPPPASWWARIHAMPVTIEGPTQEVAAGIRAIAGSAT